MPPPPAPLLWPTLPPGARPPTVPAVPPRSNPWALGGVLAAVLVVVVALAAAGTGNLGRYSDRDADAGSVATRAAAGFTVAAALVTLAFAAFHLARRRRAPSNSASGRGPASARSQVLRAMPWLVALCAVGALIGAATAPLRDKVGSDPFRGQSSGGGNSNSSGGGLRGVLPDDPTIDSAGRGINRSLRVFEGLFTLDPSGRSRVAIDSDRDGDQDTVLTPCAGAANAAGVVPSTRGPSPSRWLLVPIDWECDGVVDAYARVPAATLSAPRTSLRLDSSRAGSGRSGSGSDRDGDESSSGGSPSDDGLTNSGGLPAWLLIVFVALVAAVLGTIVVLVARRWLRAPDEQADDGEHTSDVPIDPAAAALAVESTIDRMLVDPDPRTAIIGAYAQLLEGLAAVGLPRAVSETPHEYLRRCLTTLHVDGVPIARLTALFEIARFSTHPLNEGHRTDALGALQSVKAQLLQPAAAAVS